MNFQNGYPLVLILGSFKKKSEKYISALDSAIAQDSELKSYIEKLETKYDSAVVDFPPVDDDLLLKDLEKFLETNNKGNDSSSGE